MGTSEPVRPGGALRAGWPKAGGHGTPTPSEAAEPLTPVGWSLRAKRALVLLVLLLVPSPAFPWPGRVTAVIDGDTIEVLREGRDVQIRLYGIDAPEKRQAFGRRAKQAASALAFRKTVEVRDMDRDRYGRTVAVVTLPSGQIFQEKMLEAGMAWVFTKYCRADFCARWKELEAEARARQIGLWADPDPVPPWEFRTRGRP